ncbi:hypothetical protein PX506_000001, partial [Salmonella enterica]|nr:hypothetical protein [Salmonella enterica]EKH8728864.1 hypothetical protein [Salmonella enterica]EKI1391629.1 hypothetical protein [Salmonella enterica]EKO0837911.1 hypothetical protein [Salmonella enterica]EKP8332903.1 hypothetical protein [Salmonella enterica]
FSNIDDILAHLQGEPTGHWLIGSNGMWHGGIHITDATTPWCALSGKAPQEVMEYPVPGKGEQAIRCMADGEVVAYRINRDYLTLPWESGDLFYSSSFVLVRHHIQPGQTAASSLTFYTLYMHLAPWSAYPEESTAYKVADGQHLKAYVDDTLQWTATTLKPGTRVNWNKSDPAAQMTARGRRYAHVSLVEGITDKMNLNAGDLLWVVCDNGNLLPDHNGPERPAWWSNLLPPAKETMQFDTVVCPTPYPIRSGDAIGHLGYYQAPKDGGYNGRYQVHIECFTTDDLPRFLSNSEHVERDKPAFGKYPAGIPLYMKNSVNAIYQSQLTTHQDGIFSLNGSQHTEDNQVTYWQAGASRGYLAESDLKLLSRYDLAERGFETVEASPRSFDHLDGKNQPAGLVRHIFQMLFNASSKDPRTSHAQVKHNYQRLLDKIDSGETRYSAQEYRRAVQNPDYIDHLQHLCVKHPGDWYCTSDDPVWQAFFTTLLKKEAPEWYSYGIRFLNATRWMDQVPDMSRTPWHMHPLVFLDAISTSKKRGWAHSPFADLLGCVESKNDYTAYNQIFHSPERSVAHYDTNLTSMTLQQVMDAQANPGVMFATGRFQLIPATLQAAVHQLHLDSTALYDSSMQDRIFNDYLIKIKRPEFINYLEGDGNVEDAIYAWAKEFASAGVRKGKQISKGRISANDGHGYYDGDGLNKASLLPDDMVRALEESK